MCRDPSALGSCPLWTSAGRVGELEDTAGAAVYLASRADDYVVGSTITLDGGASLTR
ncbi:hypothetical protein MTP03_44490 [Tsukamurella sp. PLM1]|nr:hypothetical protein MTP03_44490 [Tsukamurella sp. PLM1]